jgi:hypothetical protein
MQDFQRTETHKMYKPDGLRVWNGNAFGGSAEIERALMELPVSQHKVECLDAQPVVADPSKTSLLILASGTVKYGMRPEMRFTETFVLEASAGADMVFQIASDMFRTSDQA